MLAAVYYDLRWAVPVLKCEERGWEPDVCGCKCKKDLTVFACVLPGCGVREYWVIVAFEFNASKCKRDSQGSALRIGHLILAGTRCVRCVEQGAGAVG